MICGLVLALCLFPALIHAQTSNPSLRGLVVDTSGAAVPAITVQVVGPHGTKLEAQTDEQGRYVFRNSPARRLYTDHSACRVQ